MAKTLTINGHLVRAVALIPGGDVKAIGDGAQTLWEAVTPDYFFIENYTQSANTVAFPKTGDAEEWVSLDYSLDGRTWYPYDLETGVSIPAGGKLYLKGDNANLSKSVSGAWTTHSFTSTGAILAGGNALSLLDSTLPATKTVSGGYGFSCVFMGNTNLLSTDSALFDGVDIDNSYAFYRAFDGCTNLTNVPAFGGVTNVTQSSFTQTFRNCTSITTAAGFLPNAVRTTSALVFQGCFYGCTSLVTPPDLSSIVPGSGNSVFIDMFYGCTSLATPAEVYSPVPNVAGTHKLSGMFRVCTSLTRSPKVYIPNPTANILLNTFTGCGSLDLIRVTFDSWGTDGEYTNEWTYGVHSTGVFCKTSSLPVTRNARDAAQSACDYIPYLWSIADQNGKLYAPVFTYDGQAGTMAIAEAEGGQSCEIYYTTDGTTPTPQTGTLYTGVFAVTPGQTIKAISHYGGASSAYVTDSDIESYTVSSGGLPQNTFMFNYNAKEYNQSSHTFPKASGQLFDRDLVLNYSPSADHSSDGYVTMNGRSYMDVKFTRNSDNVFNRQNTAEGRTLTLVFKVAWRGSGGREAAFLGNRGSSQSDSDNTWNYMMRYNLFHVTNGPSIQAQGSSPLVFYVRVNSDASCIYKCATNGVYSEASGVSYGNPSGNFTFFGDSNYANSTSLHFQGSFYWMYLSHEALTDAEIQQVIDYNENL